MTQKAQGNAQLGGAAATSFSPIACNSSANTVTTTAGATTSSGCHNGLAGTVGSSNANFSGNAYSIGVIHTF